MLNIELRNLQRKVSLNKAKLKNLTEKATSSLMMSEGDLSLVFVGINLMKKLNYVYRGHNKPTDVLSFLLEEKPFLGEIIVCPEAILREDSKQKFKSESLEEKVFRRIVHGLLHLCSYDHQTEDEARVMKAKENQLLKGYRTKNEKKTSS